MYFFYGKGACFSQCCENAVNKGAQIKPGALDLVVTELQKK